MFPDHEHSPGTRASFFHQWTWPMFISGMYRRSWTSPVCTGHVEKSIVVQCFSPTRVTDTGSVNHTPVYTAHVGVWQTNQNIPEIFHGTGSGRRDIILQDRHRSSQQQQPFLFNTRYTHQSLDCHLLLLTQSATPHVVCSVSVRITSWAILMTRVNCTGHVHNPWIQEANTDSVCQA